MRANTVNKRRKSHPKKPSLRFRAAVVVMVSAVALFFAEFASRVFIPRLPAPVLIYLHMAIKSEHPEVMDAIKKHYPDLHEFQELSDENWSYPPHAVFKGQDAEGMPYDASFTSEGFLTPDDPDPTVVQQVVIGDSFLSRYMGKPMPFFLRSILSMPVYSVAAPAWGPSNYLDGFKRFAAHRNSKQVAVFSYENDINDALNYRAWKKNPGKLTYLKYQAAHFWVRGISQESINYADGWLDRNSVLWNWFRFVMIRIGVIGTASAEDSSFLNKQSHYPFLEYNPEEFLPGGSQRALLEPYFEQMLVLRDAIAATGKRMVLFWIPCKERVYLPLLDEVRRKEFILNTSGKIDGYNRAMALFAAKEKIDFVDTTAPLIEYARRGQRLYYQSDVHFNAAGSAALAEIAAKKLKRR